MKRFITIICLLCCFSFVLHTFSVPASAAVSEEYAATQGYDVYKAWYTVNYSNYSYFINEYSSVYESTIVRHENSAIWKSLEAAWRISTFNISSETEYAKKEYGYYEALLFNLLYDENSDSVLQSFLSEYNSNVKTTEKIYKASASSLISKTAKLYEEINELDFDPMRQISEANADEVKKIFDMASSCKEVQEACKIIGKVTEYLDYFGTTLELLEGLCKLQTVLNCTKEINLILTDMASKCTDVCMKTAISNFINYTSSSMSPELAIGIFTGQVVLTEAISKVSEEIYKKVISSLNLYGYAFSAGQTAGKFAADTFFGTSDSLSSYYELRAVYNFENLIKSVVTQYGNSYSSSTLYAQKFNSALAMLFKTRIYGIDKYTQYLNKSVYGGGLNELLPDDPDAIASLWIPGTTNEDVTRMLTSLNDLKEVLISSMIIIDEVPLETYNNAKELYNIDCSHTVTIPITDITGIESTYQDDFNNAKDTVLSFKAEFDKNFTLTEDLVVYDHTKLTGGTLDLNGHTLTIYGDFVQSASLKINGGSLIVKGDYYLNGTVESINASTITIDGDLIVASDISTGTTYLTLYNSTVNIGGDFICGYITKTGSYATTGAYFKFYDNSIMNVYGNYIYYQMQETYYTSGIIYYASGCINIYGNEFFLHGASAYWGENFSINFYSSEPIDIDCQVSYDCLSAVSFNIMKDNQTVTLHNTLRINALNGSNLTIISDNTTLSVKEQNSSLNIIGDIKIDNTFNQTSAIINSPNIHVKGDLEISHLALQINGNLTVDGNLTLTQTNTHNGTLIVTGNLLHTGYGSLILNNSTAEIYGNVDFGSFTLISSTAKIYGDTLDCEYISTSDDSIIDFFGKTIFLHNANINLNLRGNNDITIKSIDNISTYITINSIENQENRRIIMSGNIRINDNPIPLTVYSDNLILTIHKFSNDVRIIGDVELTNLPSSYKDITVIIIGDLYVTSDYLTIGENFVIDVQGNIYRNARNPLFVQNNGKLIIRGNVAALNGISLSEASVLDFYGTEISGIISVDGTSAINFYGSKPLNITASNINASKLNIENIDTREINISCPSITVSELSGNNYIINADGSNFKFSRIVGNVTFNGNIGLAVTTAIKGNIVVNGDLSVTENIQMNGYPLTVNGNLSLKSGTIDVNRNTLTINDSLSHTGGTLNINNGTVDIKNNYIMATKVDENTYNAVYATLYMQNDHDVLLVGGNMFTYSSYTTANYLKAGRLEIKGNFTQYGSRPFVCSGTHETILNGTQIQHITLENTTSTFNLLYLAQSTEQYVFNPGKCWVTLEDSPYILPENRPVVWNIFLSPGTISTTPAENISFSAVIFGKNLTDTTVIWTISGNTDEDTTIDNTGLLTFGEKEKSEEIIVTATSSFDTTKSANATVILFYLDNETVITNVIISPGNLIMAQGDSEKLSAIITGRNITSQEIIWEIFGNNSIYTTISENGNIFIATDELPGTITVRATAKNYEDFYAEIYVKVVMVPTVEVSYGGQKLKEFDDLPDIFLSSESTPGTIYLIPDQTLKSGTHQYKWVFEPEDSNTYATICGYIELSASPNCLHTDTDNDGLCDNCEKGINETYCKYCDKYHTGIFAKFLKFFHLLINFFKIDNKNNLISK